MTRRRVGRVKNLRTIEAYRGESLTINLGKEYTGGTLTAWMKKDPNSETFRSFDIVDQSTIKLTAEKASDYTDGLGNVTEAVEGKWYFDVEFLPDGVGEESVTVLVGTILFVNDITNSAGFEVTDPNTGNNIIENIVLTEETDLDAMQTPGQFAFDVDSNNTSDITFSAFNNITQNLSYFLDDLHGIVLKVSDKHNDNSDDFLHITQELRGGDRNVYLRRTFSTDGSQWTDWKSMHDDTPVLMLTTTGDLDLYREPGTFYFDMDQYEVSDYTYRDSDGFAKQLDTLLNDIQGATLKVHRYHRDNSDAFTHITQTLIGGYETIMYQRQYNSEDANWSRWKRLDEDGTPNQTLSNNLDDLTIPGSYFFNTQAHASPADISMTINGDASNMSQVVDQLEGTYVRVFGNHNDKTDNFEHITQEVVEGVSGRTYRRQYNSEEGWWHAFIELTASLIYVTVNTSRNFTNKDIGRVLIVQNTGVVLTMPSSGMAEHFNCCIKPLTGFDATLAGSVTYDAPNGLAIAANEMVSIGRLGNIYIVSP